MSEIDPNNDQVSRELSLTDSEKAELRDIAREALDRIVRKGPVPTTIPTSPGLERPGAVYVCLYKQRRLRGCMGVFEAQAPLWRTVRDMTEAAASRDPRFRPVAEEELPFVDIEISVLTPLKEAPNIEEIQIGRHGLFVSKGDKVASFLPQVAAERDWSVDTFLAQVCRKAGLSATAWKDRDTRMFVFTADVF